jgi:hypothetical protein
MLGDAKTMIIFKYIIKIKNIENLLFTERHQINCKVYFIIRKAIVIRKLDV